VQVTLDPEFAEAVDRAAIHLDAPHGRAGMIRELALRGAEEVSLQADRGSRVEAEALEGLLTFDFSGLSDIVTRREADLQRKLGLPPQRSQA
jgi:hypothetical protein